MPEQPDKCTSTRTAQAWQIGPSFDSGSLMDVTRATQAIETPFTHPVFLLKQTYSHFLVLQFALTPRLRLDEFKLCASSSLMILSNFSTHTEAKGYHVVLLTVPWATALDVVQQSCLQCPALLRGRNIRSRFEELFFIHVLVPTS